MTIRQGASPKGAGSEPIIFYVELGMSPSFPYEVTELARIDLGLLNCSEHPTKSQQVSFVSHTIVTVFQLILIDGTKPPWESFSVIRTQLRRSLETTLPTL